MVDTSFLSLPALLVERAERDPGRRFALDVHGGALTYGELQERTMLWADALQQVGIGAGDAVLTMVPNSVEALSIWLGCASLRAVEVPVNNELRGRTLAHVLKGSDADVLVIAADLVTHVVAAGADAPELARLRLVVLGASTGAGDDVPWPQQSGAQLLAAATPRALPPPADHDVACVLHTSGTTGPAKGVVVPWGNLHASALGSLPVDDLGEGDVWYGPGSASHVGAKSMPFLFAMVSGKVVLRERFSTNDFWRDVAEHGVTSTQLVGAMAHFLLRQPPQPDDAETTLRNVLMVPVLPEFQSFNARFGTRIYTVFNMTEISVPIRSDGWNIRRWDSAGRVRSGYPGYQVRLVDEHDHDVPPGSVGELVVRTDAPWALNAGYLNQPAATAVAWRNGWFHTGDLLRQDADGEFTFVDRAKDALRVSGENVSSAEVEAEVEAHPNVLESAVVAVPSAYGEDDIKVYVVAAPGYTVEPGQLCEFLAPRMPKYMLPRYVEVVDELPRNWRLRVRKDLLRARGVGSAWDRAAADRGA